MAHHPTREERKKWLKQLREPYLNFLRNLTPQVLIASMLWLLARRIDFTTPGWSGVDITFYFYALLAAFIAAVWANTSMFYESAFAEVERWKVRKLAAVRRHVHGRWKTALLLARAIWHERLVEHAAIVFFVVIVQAAFIITVAASIGAAASYLRAVSK